MVVYYGSSGYVQAFMEVYEAQGKVEQLIFKRRFDDSREDLVYKIESPNGSVQGCINKARQDQDEIKEKLGIRGCLNLDVALALSFLKNNYQERNKDN